MQHQQRFRGNLSQPAYLILACLMHGPMNAVALRDAVEQTEDLFTEPGTLYRVLAKLEQRGWIEALDSEESLRSYRITEIGLLAVRQREGAPSALCRGKEILMRLVIWILRLYPPGWRERYEAEMVALLEQYDVTFWTVLDLLIGALDARLDPHYRRVRPLVPLRRLRTSWWLMTSAWIGFWLGLAFWFSMWDMGIGPDASWCNAGGECAMRHLVGALTPSVISNMGTLAVFTFLAFVAALAQILKSREAILIVGNKWEKRRDLLLGLFVRMLALLVTGGMGLLCIISGIWLIAIWSLFPRINLYYSGTQTQLLLGFVMMLLATIIALFALMRGSLALRGVYAASPKQEPLQQVHEQG